MTLGFHRSLGNTDIATVSAESVGRRVLHDILQLEQTFQPFDTEWEASVLEAGRFAESLRKVGETAKFLAMTLVMDHWNSLSQSFRADYNYQWAVYVQREVGIKPSTAENYARAIRTFFFEEKKPTELVKVAKTGKDSRPIKDKATGQVEVEYVPFDPAGVDITKLVRIRPMVESNNMTPTLWSMLADSTVTVDTLTTEMYSPNGDDSGSGPKTTKTTPTLSFSLEGDVVLASKFGEVVEIATINFEMYETQAGRDGIHFILRCLGIDLDEDVIAEMAQETHVRILKQVYAIREGEEDGKTET